MQYRNFLYYTYNSTAESTIQACGVTVKSLLRKDCDVHFRLLERADNVRKQVGQVHIH